MKGQLSLEWLFSLLLMLFLSTILIHALSQSARALFAQSSQYQATLYLVKSTIILESGSASVQRNPQALPPLKPQAESGCISTPGGVGCIRMPGRSSSVIGEYRYGGEHEKEPV